MKNGLVKKDLNQNIRISEGNLQSFAKGNKVFLTFSLPCKETCPFATTGCMKRCFAQKNQYFKSVYNSRKKNYLETLKDTFVRDMIEYIEYHLNRKKMIDKTIYFRIHTSGDFYSIEYLEKWVQISNHFKGNEKINFQCYTKSMPLIIDYLALNNIDVNERALDSINIHMVWSKWFDTKEEYNELANKLDMQVFTAVSKLDFNNNADKKNIRLYK